MKDQYILIINLRRLCKENIETFISASALGYKIVLMARQLPGKFEHYVDKFYEVDTSNEGEVFDAADRIFSELNVKGVLPSSETNVAFASRISEKHGLPGMPSTSNDNARLKSAMREAGRNNPAVAIRNRVIRGANELDAAAEYVGFPLIIKPAAGMGSIGIFMVQSENELDYFRENYGAVSFSATAGDDEMEFIVEEYIEGQEVCIDGVISNGHVTVYGIGDKWTTDKHHLEYYEIFPSSLPDDVQAEAVESACSIIRDFGFDNCTFHMEGKISRAGFKLIEVGARPGGDHWISHVLRTVTGINGYQEAIKICVGLDSRPEVKYNCYAAIRYLLAEKSGKLTGYRDWDKAANIPEIEYIIPEVAIGSEIRLPPDCYRSQKLINFIGRSTDYTRLKAVMDSVVDTIEPIIE